MSESDKSPAPTGSPAEEVEVGAAASPSVPVMDEERQAKLQVIEDERREGNEKLKAQDYQGALRIYYSVLLKVRGFPTGGKPEATPEQIAAAEAKGEQPPLTSRHILALTYLNSAMCHLGLHKWSRAEDLARQALAVEEKNKKAKYRLGEALIGKGLVGEALKLYEEMNKEHPGDAAVNDKLATLRKPRSPSSGSASSSKLKGAFASPKPDATKAKADGKGKGKADDQSSRFEEVVEEKGEKGAVKAQGEQGGPAESPKGSAEPKPDNLAESQKK